MKKASYLFLFAFILYIKSYSQPSYPTVINEIGDTININYNIPDSAYIRNEILIKFKPNGLFLHKLCYYYSENEANKKSNSVQGLSESFTSYLYNQRFSVDSLIVDTNLVNVIKMFGGDTLSRITSANPCSDTISISRLGDSIGITHYLWLKLHLKNDTSAINLAYFLSLAFQSQLDIASLNFIYKYQSTPLDGHYNNFQTSLKSNFLNVPKAWDYEVGSEQIKIAVIDQGIDYQHYDFGGDFGPNYKVAGGWNYSENNKYGIWVYSWHGTMVAGVIGALTNRNCTYNNNTVPSIAGIAGGWGPMGGQTDRGLGPKLYGYRVDIDKYTPSPSTAHIISALYQSASKSTSYYHGDGVDVINMSFAANYYDLPLLTAVRFAYENNVSVIAGRGNGDPIDENTSEDGTDEYAYPACFAPKIVTSVGAYNHSKSKLSSSFYGKNMDFLAPGDKNDIATTKYYTWRDDLAYTTFGQTSAATAHVSGLMGLLKSSAYNYQFNNRNNIVFTEAEPEDYEGILKASTENSNNNNYTELLGWGLANIGNVYSRIEDDNYHLKHYSETNGKTYGTWSSWYQYNFVHDGNHPYRLKDGRYWVRRREVTLNYTIDLNEWEMFNNNYPLFVWGRENRGRSGGFSATEPNNYQTRDVSISSGSGGVGNVDGIWHTNNQTISLKTYQYDVQGFGLLPTNAEIEFNFSIWGRPKSSTDVEFFKVENNDLIKKVTKEYGFVNLLTNTEVNFESGNASLYNLLGEKVKTEITYSNSSFRINVQNLPVGTYFIHLSNLGKNEVVKISL